VHRRLLAMVAAMGVSSCALAEGDADGTDGYFSDFPVVLSASRLVQTVDEAPAAVTVIDREMIKASGAREVVDLFRLVPGMVVGQYKGHQPTLGFFGLSDPLYRQLQVLIDGVSIYSSAWGGAEWSELPIALEDIERIEVVRGPNAATFGGNSFLGVVNIITRDPALEHGGQLVTNVGENQIRDIHVRHAVNDGDFRYRLTAGQRADEGLDSYPDSRRTNFLNLRAHLRLNASDELRVQTAYAGGAQESGTYSSETDGPRSAHYDSGSLQFRWTRVHSADEELWLQFSHSQRSVRDVFPYVLVLPASLPPSLRTWNYPVDYSYERRRTDLEMQHTTRLAESIRAVWGGQFRSDGVRSMTYFNSPEWLTSSLYRIFGNLEWRPAPGWIAAGGAILEKNTFTDSAASPSIAISREVIPNHTVRLRFASAHRTPTLYEDRADWAYPVPAGLQATVAALGLSNLPLAQSSLGNPDLKDERVRSRELSYLAKLPDLRLTLEAHWFEHRVSDLIRVQWEPVQTVMGSFDDKYARTLVFRNLNSARITGVSGAIRWHPRQGTQVYFAGSRANIRSEGADSNLIDASGPQNTVSLLASQDLPMNFQIGCGYYMVGRMRSLSAGDPLSRTEKVDLRLAKKFRLESKSAEVALVVQRATGGEPVFGLKDIDKRTARVNMLIEY
jgi:iron complex outermembrane recepter protein